MMAEISKPKAVIRKAYIQICSSVGMLERAIAAWLIASRKNAVPKVANSGSLVRRQNFMKNTDATTNPIVVMPDKNIAVPLTDRSPK